MSYNCITMNGKVAGEKVTPTRVQVYFTGDLQEAFLSYLKKSHPDSRAMSLVVRQALRKFLKSEGYLDADGGGE